MHGLINRSFESFVRKSHGEAVWEELAAGISVDRRGFQAVRNYPNQMTMDLIHATSRALDVSRQDLLEDIGAWLPKQEAVRRLLRFSGSDYHDFVQSLDELSARADMVLPGLGLPGIDVEVLSMSEFILYISGDDEDWSAVLAGLLRAMADDYGVLALVENRPGGALHISIPDSAFSTGKRFDLAVARQG